MYAILYGPNDEPASWIQAGRALSAMWLYAVAHNIAVLPLSAAVEETFTRQSLYRMLGGLGYAQLAVRLGIADPNQEATPHTPRLPASETITIVGLTRTDAATASRGSRQRRSGRIGPGYR